MGERAVVESVAGRPPAGLRPYVPSYVGYRQVGLPPGLHRGLPSPYLTVVVTLDEPLTLAAAPGARGQDPRTYPTLVGGLHTSPALITHQGTQAGIQLALSPLGARALLGLPAGALAGTVVEGTDLLGALAAQLHERVRAATTWRDRFAAVDAFLLRRLRPERTPPPEVARAWRLLRADPAVTIPALSKEVGWSERHLRARFAAETGLTPKAAARVVRFDRTAKALIRRVGSGHPADLATTAAVGGFYDQAHLAREFRALAGCPPSVWLTEERRNIQAVAGFPREDSPA